MSDLFKTSKPVLIVACGGTGGHVYPGIAVAQCLTEFQPVFFGSHNRQDAKIVPAYGYPFISILAAPKNIFKLGLGFCQAFKKLRELKPKVVIGTGSYHTIPVILAAKLLKIPIILLEQNAIPGRVNRLLARYADKVCLSFEESSRFFKNAKTVVTGNPVRISFEKDHVLPESLWEKLDSKPMVLIFGGSQGAKTINDASTPLYTDSKLSNPFIIVHITGMQFFEKYYPGKQYEVVKNKDNDVQAIVLPYTENMGALYKKASVVVSRSGATTIAELLLFQKPAILIPFPYATDNHQMANAEAFCREGKGLILSNADVNPKRLLADILVALELVFPDSKPENSIEKIKRVVQEVLNDSVSTNY